MSSSIDNGGPAFPATCSSEGVPLVISYPAEQVSGMSLRDWFAGMALNSIIKSCGDIHCYYDVKAGSKGDNDIPSPDAVASFAYEIAESMLAARKEGK